jgi:hypothetical protein
LDKEQVQSFEEDHEQFLISVSWETEADVLESLLNSYGIPVLRKYRESGSYMNVYMGTTVMGVDLYVPSKLHSKAVEIVDSRPEDETPEDNIADIDTQKYNKKRKVFLFWTILIFICPVIITIVLAIYKLTKYLIG